MKPRTILTPVLDTDLSVQDGGRSYWKKILLEGPINYRDNKSGKTRRIDFSREVHDDLITAYEQRALDQTPLQLADADNTHTMDPERYRGEVTRMAHWEDLPPEVQASFGDEGGPGLYSKIRFATKTDAEAVLRNPKLGVSARIREGVERAVDGKVFKRAIVHVLGTLDPKVTGLGSWQPAVDLSGYDPSDVLDLSAAAYTEVPVAKNKGKTGTDVQAPDITELTEEDIAELSDAQLTAFLAKYGDLVSEDDSDDDDSDDDDSDDDSSEEDDDADDSDDEDESVREPGELQEAALSNAARKDIELANATATQANQRATEALKRAADAEWRETKTGYLAQGVPPHLLDLAEPVLNRPDEMVIDLSNTDDEDVNVSEIVRGLLDSAKGQIDVDVELGHGGHFDANGEDPEAEALAALTELTS